MALLTPFRFVFRPVPAIYCQTIYVLTQESHKNAFLFLSALCVCVHVRFGGPRVGRFPVCSRIGEGNENKTSGAYTKTDSMSSCVANGLSTTTLLLTQHHSTLSHYKTTQKPKIIFSLYFLFLYFLRCGLAATAAPPFIGLDIITI